MPANTPSTRDHHVPRMYLKRFARARGSRRQLGAMTPDMQDQFVTSIDRAAVERGFYWGTDLRGVPHHDLEDFLRALESDATPAFRRVLDSGRLHTDDALPPWPPTAEVRMLLSWWIAAQILRTVRQRERLAEQIDPTEPALAVPRRFRTANRHIQYIIELIEGLAASIFYRPWGIGFAGFCLLTGDVPVLVLNGQDHPDQHAAVRFWDVYLPLDPHRCLYLPGENASADSYRRSDHRFTLHAGHVLALNSLIMDTAVRHVFFHPEHDPTKFAEPAVRSTDGLPQMLLHYGVLPPGYGIERRWLHRHPDPTDGPVSSRGQDEVIASATELSEDIERRQLRFDSSSPVSRGARQ